MTHDHAAHLGGTEGAIPELPGDDIFGAIAEIVAMLSSDPATDWSRVDIGALREHLLDMDAVGRGPAADAREVDGGVEILIPTVGPAGDAATRMVTAHAPVLATETGWSSTVQTTDDGKLAWRVTGHSPDDSTKIRALGFFGLLATGAHHQAHHLAMAKGVLH
ncbi:hypothetical protein [Pseudooceanicola sp. LIPI14-2-Ac024]|uniref:hypothetical protein n=1 Tax=Pseudooceanicola sp. LIPI14-2-Ac024 TaxID=3344875 RepID=UPI0035D117BD